MKVGLIVLCRFNSSRLPGKILKEINQKPLIDYILRRLKKSQHSENIIIATSNQQSDDPIADFAKNNNLKCYRGDLENVSLRFAQCMNHFELDYGVRINGDNIFTDPSLIDFCVNNAIEGNYDFVSNVLNRTFPTGMSVEVVKRTFYNQQIINFDNKDYKEHVTLYFYEHLKSGNFYFVQNEEMPAAKGLKMAVDTKEDFNFVASMISKMSDPIEEYDWKAITELYLNAK